MQNIDAKKDFNTLILNVENCLKSSLPDVVAYFFDLLSQKCFLSIIKTICDNDFTLTNEIIEKIVSNDYRVCDVQSIIDCMIYGFWEHNIILPYISKETTKKATTKDEIDSSVIKEGVHEVFNEKYFNSSFLCEETVGKNATYCLKISSNLFDVNKLIRQITDYIGAIVFLITKNEISVSFVIANKIYNSSTDCLFNGIFTVEENRNENYMIVHGKEKEISFLFRIVRLVENQTLKKINAENARIKLERIINTLDDFTQGIKLNRIIKNKELLLFFEKNGRREIKDLLVDMPCDTKVEYVEELTRVICEIDKRSITQMLADALVKLNPREEVVLRQRFFGNSIATLESIGKLYNVSRERIRQVEIRAVTQFKRYMCRTKTRIADLLRLRSEFENFFTENELVLMGLPKHLGVFLGSIMEEVLWDVDLSVGFYDQKLGRLINQELETIPNEFLVSELDEYAMDVAQSIGGRITSQEVAYLVKCKYKKVGDFLIIGKLTLRVVFAYLIKRYFPDGFDIYDEKNIQFLREKAREHFDGFELAENDRAIASRVQNFCTPVARGVWKWSNDESLIDEHLKEDLCVYINEYKSPVVPIRSVYAAFEERLNDVEIYNKYHLQGEIKKSLNGKYSVSRDYIFKDSTTSFYMVLESFIKEAKIPVTKRDILKNFPGVQDITIQQACAATKILNMNGFFVHLDNLAISDDERSLLKQSVDNQLAERIIYHAKNVFMNVKRINAGLFNRIGIEHYLQFFYLTRELFPNAYEYNRPFIAQLGVEMISGEAQVIERISAKTETDISEVRQYACEVGTTIERYIEFVDRNNDTFIFKNEHAIIMLEAAGIYDDEFADIDDIINVFLGKLQYRNIGEFYDYWKLPKLNCAWNQWVLYSLINKYSKKFKGIVSSNSLNEAIPFVARQEVKLEDIDFSNASKIAVFDDEKTDLEDILEFDDLE